MKKVVLNNCFGGFGLSKEAYEFLGLPWDGYGFDFNNDRSNPILVECVEKLGEKANGSYAELTVEEYDDEKFDYCIDEYDGLETLTLIPYVRKSLLKTMNIDEIVEYLISLNINVVD